MKHISDFGRHRSLSTGDVEPLLRDQAADLVSIPRKDAEFIGLVHRMVADNPQLHHMFGYSPEEAARFESYAGLAREIMPVNIVERVEELALAKHHLTKRKTQLERYLGKSIAIGKRLVARLGGARMEAQEARREAQEALLKAETDPLTGLKNKGAADVILNQMLEYAKREPSHKITLIFLDIDHFKKINDTYGHATGNVVLKHFASVLSRHVRGYDLVARYGGEEFVIAMSADNDLPALEKAGAICKNIAETPCYIDDKTSISITASLGVTLLDPTTNQTVESAIIHADQAMYLAKRLGRNRVCFGPYRDSPVTPETAPHTPQSNPLKL